MQVQITRSEQAALEQIKADGAGMIARVKEWSQINSGSMNLQGLRAQRHEIVNAFSELGGVCDQISLPPTSSVDASGQIFEIAYEKTIRIVQRPHAPIQILLTGHYDTVFAKDSSFQTVREIKPGILNGPGVADMKGGLLVMLQALLSLEKSENAANLGYTVLINPDEEIGSTGSADILHQHAVSADLGMTYEPALSDGSLSGARKGSGNFSIVIRGRSAHAGREHHLGRNALVVAAKAISRLADLSGVRPGLTVNPAKLEGGGANNVVPDLAIVRFNVRLSELNDMTWFQGQLDEIISSLREQEGIKAELHGGFTRPPKPMAPPNAALFQMTRAAGQALGMDLVWNSTGGVCEGNNLWAAGCPNVDTLGVCGGEIHSDREFVITSSFVERAQLSALLLFKFANGDFDAKSLRNLK